MRTRVAAGAAAIGLGLILVGAALPASASLDKSVSSGNLKALTNAINQAKHATYEATYKSVSDGQTTTVTIAQAPPKSNFSTASGTVINDGKKTYYCSTSDGKQSCISAGGANPILGLEDLFSPAAALGALTEAKEGLVSRVLGIKVTSTSASFAGQPSTCVSVKVKGQGGKYCVTKQGLLSYSGSSGSYFQLTKFTSKPPASLFALPAGATTVTLPGGVTIPSIP
jgi:hypothetical protein